MSDAAKPVETTPSQLLFGSKLEELANIPEGFVALIKVTKSPDGFRLEQIVRTLPPESNNAESKGKRKTISLDRTGKFCELQLKWFDPVKGYGFFVGPREGEDIYVHDTVLRGCGVAGASLQDGQKAWVRYGLNDRQQLEAAAVLLTKPPME